MWPFEAVTEAEGDGKSRRRAAFLLRLAEGAVAVGVVTFITFHLHLNLAAAGFIHLLIVLLLALRGGFWEAGLVSLLANACLNYFFIPPLFHFSIDDPQNWVALFCFESSALLVSYLSATGHRQAIRATRGRRDLERLYKLSRHLLRLDLPATPISGIASLIRQVFEASAVVLLDGKTNRIVAVGDRDTQLESEARGALLLQENLRSSNPQTTIRILQLGSTPLGVLAVRGNRLTGVTADALATLTAIAVEKAGSAELPWAVTTPQISSNT